MAQPWKRRVETSGNKSEEKPAKEAASTAAADTGKKTKAVMIDPKNFRDIGNVYYNAANEKYWRESDKGIWIPYSTTEFTRFLKTCGYSAKPVTKGGASPIDRLLVAVHHNRRVDYAGPIGGYPKGIHKMCGMTILVPKGPNLIEPIKGEWKLFKRLVEEILGDQQVYFYGWIKAAIESLQQGPPFRPGQALIIAGESGCGKSFLQNLLTVLLGGRPCKPYKFLTGRTDFNGNLVGAEHWMVEDEVAGTGHRARREFAAAIKNSIVNEVQAWHPKGVDESSVTPFIRVTITLNDNPESLQVLPPIDEDVQDKLILLKARRAKITEEYSSLERRATFRRKIEAEFPAFVHAMNVWKIPAKLKDNRYGIVAYQNPDLAVAVDQLAPEMRLMDIIDAAKVWDTAMGFWHGSAFELETQLRDYDKKGEVSGLLKNSASCGTYLARLAKKRKERVSIPGEKGHANMYKIIPPPKTR